MRRTAVGWLCVLAIGVCTVGIARADERPLRVGIIGCDTSHVIAFTKLINDPQATGPLAKVQVTVAYPGGSPDLPTSRDRLPGYVAQLREQGIRIANTLDELAEQSDAVLLESVDGRVHLEQFRAVARGKPVFIDKPAAASLADVLAIFRHAEATKTPCFSSSALRFCNEVQELVANKSVGQVVACEAVSPMSVEATHPDLFWYGVHGVESLYTLMGAGCEAVTRVESDESTLVVGKWRDGRIGSYRGVKKGGTYAATVYGNSGIVHRAGFSGYGPLVERICTFFLTGEPPVPRTDTIEMFAFMEAADESKRRGGQPIALADIVTRAEEKIAREARRTIDVLVYGGTSSGIVAAIQARRMGKSVLLIEPSNHLGGLTTGGLGATDIGNKAVIGGLARDFYHRIWRYYGSNDAWTFETRDQYNAGNARYNMRDTTMWTFEPHVATEVYQHMLDEAGIMVLLGERLDWARGVTKAGKLIETITTESGQRIRARMFIDATYEGDLMAAAGVSYHVGRESNDTYGETLNGVQPRLNVKSHRFIHAVDPYVIPGDPVSGLLPGIQATELPPDGSGDQCVQAYCYRVCTTDVPENRRPWPKPADYDETRYELLLRNFEAGDHRVPWNPIWMPNRKTDTNNNYAFSTDFIGGSNAYPEASYAEREQINAEHRSYQQGLFWTLANHPRVPPAVRDEFQQIALPRDEFIDNDNWPTQLYVREARRMIGAYVMTEHNCRGTELAADSVGMGAYGMDSHNCQRYVTPEGHVQNEGDVQVHGFKPYPISYQAIVPKADECTNLLVPVCLSSSHIAYGSIRMEPVFMILGQSAATAAALAIDANTRVQDVDYEKLAARLRVDGQVLTLDDRINP